MSNKYAPHRPFFTPLALFALAGMMIASGCDRSATQEQGTESGADASTMPKSNLQGRIEIDGSSTVKPVSNAIAEKFRDPVPGVTINVSGEGTGNGFERFANQETDISGASRPIKSGEFEECQAAGVAFIELPIAYDGLTFAIHPDNDWAETLTVDQLRKIFATDDPASTWSDVDSSWPDEPINLYSPGTGSGTYDYTSEVLEVEKDAGLRTDMALNEEDNVLVQGVASNKYSIGFFGVAYYEENKDKLKAVKVVNPDDGKAYGPTRENISSNRYAPFSRPLFIYVNAESLGKAEVQTFVDFYLKNVPETCEQVGYVSLPEELMQKSRSNFENEVVGTHFVEAKGESRKGSLSDNFVEANLRK